MLGGWPIVAAYLILYGCAAVVVVRWSGRPGWSPVHNVALAGGALLTYAWHSFIETPVIGSKGTIDLVGNMVFSLGAVVLLMAAVREASRMHEVPLGVARLTREPPQVYANPGEEEAECVA